MVNTMEEIDQVLESQTKFLHKENDLNHEIEKKRLAVLTRQMMVYLETDFKSISITTQKARDDYCEMETMQELIELSELRRQRKEKSIEAQRLEKRYDALLIKFNREA